MQNSEKNEMIAILTATSEEEMTDLVLMKDLFDTIPIILIISDESDSMVHKAHKLRPRFLATFDDDFNSILSVVENLVKDLQQKQLLSRVWGERIELGEAVWKMRNFLFLVRKANNIKE